MERWTREELLAADREADAAQVCAQELGEELTQDAPAQEEAAAQEGAQEETLDAVREGIGELFEDGWTAQELAAFVKDAAAREAVAKGHSVARAACAYLKGKLNARRHGGPTARAIAAGAHAQDNAVERMSDAEFDAFSRRAQAAMMAGKKVRL